MPQDCQHCHGSGQLEDERCPVCDGEGTVTFNTTLYWFTKAQELESNLRHVRHNHMVEDMVRTLALRHAARSVTQ